MRPISENEYNKRKIKFMSEEKDRMDLFEKTQKEIAKDKKYIQETWSSNACKYEVRRLINKSLIKIINKVDQANEPRTIEVELTYDPDQITKSRSTSTKTLPMSTARYTNYSTKIHSKKLVRMSKQLKRLFPKNCKLSASSLFNKGDRYIIRYTENQVKDTIVNELETLYPYLEFKARVSMKEIPYIHEHVTVNGHYDLRQAVILTLAFSQRR